MFRIGNLLADSIRVHLAVGYFFLYSFQAIAERIPHLDQLRLRIGNVIADRCAPIRHLALLLASDRDKISSDK